MNTKNLNLRLIPVLVPGKAWAVELRSGSGKRGTVRKVLVSEPVYTLAQAQAFVSNNCAGDFIGEVGK